MQKNNITKRIYFVATYASENAGRSLLSTPSSNTLNKYLISAFSRLPNKRVMVLSMSRSKDVAYFNKKEINLTDHSEIYFPSLPSKWGAFATRISQITLYVQVLIYLLMHAKRGDTLVIYHNFGIEYIYGIFRKLLPCKLVYMVGEVYNAVYDRGNKAIQEECLRLLNGDSYIYANDIMPHLINPAKDFCVCYGNYYYSHTLKIKDGKTHVLYAGKISTGIINDAFIALEVIKHLPQNYVMHVAGYGDKSDISELKKRISSINIKAAEDRIIYEGNLSGEAYEQLLSKCQIGLCTRALRDELSNYCFPSKTLVYLAHDIIPICSQINCLMKSRIAANVVFVDGNLTPENIADAIKESNHRILEYNNNVLLSQLDRDFVRRLSKIL